MRVAKGVTLVGLVLILGMWLYDKFSPEAPEVGIKAAWQPLKHDETLRVVAHENQITIVDRTGSVTKYVPDAGYLTVTEKIDGKTEVEVKNHGLSLRPGGSLFYADAPRLGLDVQIAYWDRLGVNVGLGLSRAPVVVGFLALSYQLDHIHLDNTALMVGVTTEKRPLIGLRVRF